MVRDPAERDARQGTSLHVVRERSPGAPEDFTAFGEARRWLTENAGRLARLFRVARDSDTGPVITRKRRAVAQAVARMGYTVVLTTVPGQTPSQVLAEYRSRDRVEKIVDSLKNENGKRRHARELPGGSPMACGCLDHEYIGTWIFRTPNNP